MSYYSMQSAFKCAIFMCFPFAPLFLSLSPSRYLNRFPALLRHCYGLLCCLHRFRITQHNQPLIQHSQCDSFLSYANQPTNTKKNGSTIKSEYTTLRTAPQHHWLMGNVAGAVALRCYAYVSVRKRCAH